MIKKISKKEERMNLVLLSLFLKKNRIWDKGQLIKFIGVEGDCKLIYQAQTMFNILEKNDIIVPNGIGYILNTKKVKSKSMK